MTYSTYGTSTAGGILLLTEGLRIRKWLTPPVSSRLAACKWILREARAATLLPPIWVLIAFFITGGTGWSLYSFLLLILAGIAFFWSIPGGVLVLITGAWAFWGILSNIYDLRIKVEFLAYCSIYLAGGVLYLIAPLWRQGNRQRAKDDGANRSR